MLPRLIITVCLRLQGMRQVLKDARLRNCVRFLEPGPFGGLLPGRLRHERVHVRVVSVRPGDVETPAVHERSIVVDVRVLLHVVPRGLRLPQNTLEWGWGNKLCTREEAMRCVVVHSVQIQQTKAEVQPLWRLLVTATTSRASSEHKTRQKQGRSRLEDAMELIAVRSLSPSCSAFRRRRRRTHMTTDRMIPTTKSTTRIAVHWNRRHRTRYFGTHFLRGGLRCVVSLGMGG